VITIHFCQCGLIPSDMLTGEEYHIASIVVPNARGPGYEERLLAFHKGGTDVDLVTSDELLLLVAQWLHKQGRIQARFVSWCVCKAPGPIHGVLISLDADGSCMEDIPHGFFAQRMKYLR